MDIDPLIEDINRLSEKRQWFWVYGLLKETKNLWNNEAWKARLCPNAQIVLSTVH
jgi:hypothetical protein